MPVTKHALSNLSITTFLTPSITHTLRRFGIVLIAAGFVWLTGCTAMRAQNPGSGYGPVNAVANEQGERVMLKGADVVAYFVQNKAMMGTPQFKSDYKGVTFQFANAEHKALFDKQPEKYLPEFGGYCANGLAYGIPWGGDFDTWKMVNGKLYINGGKGSFEAFMLNPTLNIERATKYWTEEVSGSNSFVQRAKRLTMRVPHYKSGGELAQDVAAAKANGTFKPE